MRFSRLFSTLNVAAIAILLVISHPGTARGEFPVDIISGSGVTGNFFQPSGFLGDTVLHLAFIQSADGNPPYKIYYCPVDGSADFGDASLTGSDLRLKDITLVDLGVPAYIDGRTPSIFPITDNDVDKVGIAFIGDNVLYFALINPNLGSATLQPTIEDVRVITVTPSVSVTALSATSDSASALHLVYGDSGSIYYASTPFDDFTSPVDNILLDSSVSPPQLTIDTDADDNAHAIWAADDSSGRWICSYAMADPDSTAVPGKVLIPKTRIFGQEGDSFLSPWISVSSLTSIYLSATNSDDALTSGTIYLANINPSLAPKDGSALVDPDEIFAASPKPMGIEFLNPVIVSDTEERTHISGGGTGGTGLTFATVQRTDGALTILENQKPVSLVDLPEPLDKFDRSALAYFSSGKAVIAWSGKDSGTSENHIFAISTTAPAFPPQPEDESGCAINGKSPGTFSGIATMLLFFGPPLYFLIASNIRKKETHRVT